MNCFRCFNLLHRARYTPRAAAAAMARDPLTARVIAGSEGKGLFTSAGVPPGNAPIFAARDGATPWRQALADRHFSTKDFYAGTAVWTDPRYYRCNSPVGIEQIWGAYEVPLIGYDPPRSGPHGIGSAVKEARLSADGVDTFKRR